MTGDQPIVDPMEVMAAMRLEDGRRWGEAATEWQWADAEAILKPGPGDPLLHWLGRPKGGSKSTDVGGLASAWLLTQAAPLDEGFVIASDRDQAARLLTRAAGLIARTPGLSKQLEVQAHAIVNRASGAKVVALAADVAGTEGVVAPILLLDETPQWADTKAARGMWDAAFSSIPKVPGMRFVVIGHAGVKGSWQHRLIQVVAKSPLWRVNDVPGPLPWVDEAVLADQAAILVPSQFERRHLNRWGDGEDALTTVEALRKCVTLDGPLAPQPGVRYVVAVDLGLKNDRTVAVVGHLEALHGGLPVGVPVLGEQERALQALRERGVTPLADYQALEAPKSTEPVRIVLDRIETWQGSRKDPVSIPTVEAWLMQAHQSFNGAPVVFDPWQLAGTAQRLGEKGVPVEEFIFSSASVGRLASTLWQVLRDSAISLPDDPELLDELAHVRLKETSPGVHRMDHDAGRHDDRAIALGLLCVHLLNRPAPQPGWVSTYRSGALRGTR